MRYWALTPFRVIFDEFWRTHLKKGPQDAISAPEWLQRHVRGQNRGFIGMASPFVRFPGPPGPLWAQTSQN